jgi:hypothetical protein
MCLEVQTRYIGEEMSPAARHKAVEAVIGAGRETPLIPTTPHDDVHVHDDDHVHDM